MLTIPCPEVRDAARARWESADGLDLLIEFLASDDGRDAALDLDPYGTGAFDESVGRVLRRGFRDWLERRELYLSRD